MNIALEKSILEKNIWSKSALLTDGNTKNYTGKAGFSFAPCPNILTLDLEGVFDLEVIRFLLWDHDNRSYKYRFLTSVDLQNWNVHYDTGETSASSWQNFIFTSSIKVRYIRIHGLFNILPNNNGFHIVQIEAYESKINLGRNQTKYQIDPSKTILETSDGLPISNKIKPLVSAIRDIPERIQGMDKEYYSNMANELELRIYDVEKIEKGMEAIRREIIDPVNIKLKESKKIGWLSVILGMIGGLVGIFSILNAIFKWIN